MENKKCRKCEKILPTNLFFKNHRLKDGLTYNCKLCMKLSVTKWREENKQKEADTKRKWWKRNYESVKRNNNKWRNSNRDRVRVGKLKYYFKNKETINLKKKIDRSTKPWLHRARVNNRKFRKQQATLKDCAGNELFKEEVKEMYMLAEELTWLFEGSKLEVDHIIPLYGYGIKDGTIQHVVCGLNVPWNMQILTKHHNQVKNNRFDWTYDNLEWKKLLN